MSFRSCLVAGLLSCLALHSAFAQNTERRFGPVYLPPGADSQPASKTSEAEAPLQPLVNGESDGAAEPLFPTGPASVSDTGDSELPQIIRMSAAKSAASQNCVAPSGSADGCVPTQPGCAPPCLLRHRHGIFLDYLFLGATGVDMPYALPVDGLGPVNVLQGRAAVADTQYDSGFRIGGIVALDDCTSIMATYWRWMSNENDDRIFTGGGAPFLLAQLTDPGTLNVAADSLLARANYDIDLDIVDLVVRRALVRTQSTMVNAVAGVRYAHLNQELRAQYFILGDTQVNSDIDFNGIGPRLGLEGEYVHCNGFLIYGNTHANFLVGTFNGDYVQSNIFAGPQSFTSFDDTRVVTQLELELGLGWQSKCGRCRFTVGYYLSGWFNTITQPEFIRGVQSRQLENMSDTIGFNGLTARAMFQF